MAEEVSFHRLAELELNSAASYYEREKPGLGARFLTEVDRCIDVIAEHPRAGAIILGDVSPASSQLPVRSPVYN